MLIENRVLREMLEPQSGVRNRRVEETEKEGERHDILLVTTYY
jgi:hypothetical protein